MRGEDVRCEELEEAARDIDLGFEVFIFWFGVSLSA